MHGHLDVALLLFWLSLGALLMPILAPRLGVPEAVAQIGFGILIGVLGLVDLSGGSEQVRHFCGLLAELGFILLMFGAGLEIDFDAVERGGRRGLLRGMAVALGFLLVSALMVARFDLSGIYIVILSATSVGLGVAVLRETGLTSSPVGQSILLVGSLGEVVTLIAMTVFDVQTRVGFSPQLFINLGKLALLFAVGGVFLRFLKAWAWWHPGVFRRVFDVHDASEVGVRAAIVTCLAFVVLAVALHLEAILGAFIAGAVARVVFRDVRVLEGKMSALSAGFFIPIFFISVGLNFDIAQLSWEGLRTAAFLASLVLVARVLPCVGLIDGVGISPREALGVALLLGTPLTLLVAIATLGQNLGVLNAEEASAIVLLAILLSVVLPVAFRLLFRGQTSEVAHYTGGP